MRAHHYAVRIDWIGNRGDGTKTYSGYSRDHSITADNKPTIQGSSDPAFRGDSTRYNPEELLLASLSSCHMLSYLHLCCANGIVITGYEDDASGIMQQTSDGAGKFIEVILKPKVTVADGDLAKAAALHHDAHQKCFIANSVNFPVNVSPTIL